MKVWLLHIEQFPGNEYAVFPRAEDARFALDHYCQMFWPEPKLLIPDRQEVRVQRYFQKSHERDCIVDIDIDWARANSMPKALTNDGENNG